MWLGWVECQHGMSLSVASSVQNLGFPHGNVFHRVGGVLTCVPHGRVHSLALLLPQAALCVGMEISLTLPHLILAHAGNVVFPLHKYYVPYHPKARGVVFRGLSESRIPGLENPM